METNIITIAGKPIICEDASYFEFDKNKDVVEITGENLNGFRAKSTNGQAFYIPYNILGTKAPFTQQDFLEALKGYQEIGKYGNSPVMERGNIHDFRKMNQNPKRGQPLSFTPGQSVSQKSRFVAVQSVDDHIKYNIDLMDVQFIEEFKPHNPKEKVVMTLGMVNDSRLRIEYKQELVKHWMEVKSNGKN